MIIANVTSTVYAGIPLILSSDYTLSISVDTDITTSATWTITCTGTVTGGTSATANDDVTINVMGLFVCAWLCMCVDVNVCLSTALPAPIVTISPASDVLTVGQSYTLTCNVMVVPHLVVEPTIQWTKYDGTVVVTSNSI